MRSPSLEAGPAGPGSRGFGAMPSALTVFGLLGSRDAAPVPATSTSNYAEQGPAVLEEARLARCRFLSTAKMGGSRGRCGPAAGVRGGVPVARNTWSCAFCARPSRCPRIGRWIAR